MSSAPPITRRLAILNHVALFAGLYPAGALLSAAQISGAACSPVSLACAWATGSSVYLLDRVKLADRFFDRADLAASPERFEWLCAHARTVRAFGSVLALVALVLAVLVHPAAAVLVALGHVAVIAYAHRSADPARRPRAKDILLLKNAAVGGGIASFVTALLVLQSGRASGGLSRSMAADLAAAFTFMAVLVTADAALSDLDDVATDLPFGTRTIAAAAGAQVTVMVFVLANIAAGAGLAAWAAFSSPPPARVTLYSWAALVPSTALLVALPAASRRWSVRSLIDARLPLLAGLLAVLAWIC